MADHDVLSAKALGALYENYRTALTRTARRALLAHGVPESVASAEDLVQNAFATVLRHPASVRHPVSYLRAVIRTEAATLARQQARHGDLEARRAADPLRFDPAQCADMATLVANRCAVEQAMAGLTPSQRTAVWATKGLDRTQAETAVLMGKAPGTVATHVSRGMVLLRASLVAAVIAGIVCVVGRFVADPLRHTLPAREPGGGSGAPSPPWWPGDLLSALYAYRPVLGVLSLVAAYGIAHRLWGRFRALDRSGTRLGTWWGLRRTERAWQSATRSLGLPFTAREITRDAVVFAAPSGLSARAVSGGAEAVTILMERDLRRAVQLERSGGPSSRHGGPGTSRLREAFDLTGWSRGELARLVNRRAASAGHPEVATDASRVRRWLDVGAIPRDPVPRLLADLFSERLGRVLTVEDLGLDRPAGVRARHDGADPSHPWPLPWAPERTVSVLTEFSGTDLVLDRRGPVVASTSLDAGRPDGTSGSRPTRTVPWGPVPGESQV